MRTINHNLSAGDVELLTEQLQGGTATFQFTYSGIVASTVKIEAYLQTHPDMPYALIDDATLTINPARTTDFIVLAGFGTVNIMFKLVTGGITVGVIEKVNIKEN